MKNPFRRSPAPAEKRSGLSFEEWANYFSYNGLTYPLSGTGSLQNKAEEVPPTFAGYADVLAKGNPIVGSLIDIRAKAFSEARFKFRELNEGRAGKLFGTPDLAILEEPSPGTTTGWLLTRALQDVDLSGNFYAVRKGNYIYRLRPDWVTIVIGSRRSADNPAWQYDAVPLGYIYQPGGTAGDEPAESFLAEEVAHFAPTPDPVARYRGMTWVTSVLRDASADSLATEHKIKYLEQGATPNMVVTLSENITDPEVFQQWVDKFEDTHGGVANAFKTLYLAGGTDVDVVGTDLKNADFKAVTAQGENRLAVAAGVPGIIAGLSEGLEASTYSNYAQARRRFIDLTIWPLWREIVGSLSKLVNVPGGSELWIDTTDVAFLREDAKDRAEIFRIDSEALKFLSEAGYTPESAQEAVLAQDMGRLEHSGLFSVQLQKPEATQPQLPAPSTNGNGDQTQETNV